MATADVILPTYNRANRLERAIESVLNQRFDDFELIVVDDGSTDHTETIVKSFDDPRVRYKAHSTNRGGSAARNTGVEAGNGEYIAFIDDDDEWLPDKLGRQIKCLEERPDAWIATYCDFRSVRHGRGKKARQLIYNILRENKGSQENPKPEGGSELIPIILSSGFSLGGASTLLVKRKAVEEVNGFDPGFKRHQDWEFLLRLLHVGKLAYVNDVLVLKHESSTPSADDLRDAKRALFEKFALEIEQAERDGYDVFGSHRFILAKRYFEEGQFKKGAFYLLGSNIDVIGLVRSLCVGAYTAITRS